jgi:hypothetical protein
MPNTNAEYLRLKGLLESNPQYKVMLDAISKAEGTWGADAYSTKFGGKKKDWRKGKDRASDGTSNAHGKYQFMNETWDTLSSNLGFTGFSPEEQDIAALSLLEKQGSLAHIDNGDLDKAIYSAAPVWAALPKDASGVSALKGKNNKPQKAKPLSTVMNYMNSNEAARAKINKGYAELNEKNLSKNPEDIKKYKEDYLKQLRAINAQDSKVVSDEEKEKQKNQVKSKFYREGKLLAINENIRQTNKTYLDHENKIKNIQERVAEFNDRPSIVDDATGKLVKRNPKTGKVIGDKEIIALYKELGLTPKANKIDDKTSFSHGSTTSFDLEDLKSQIGKRVNKLTPPMPIERGILKYGKTKNEYDDEVSKNIPVDTGIASDIENGTATGGETAEEKAARLKVEAAEKERGARMLAEKNKPTDNLDKFTDPGLFTDAQFEYKPGKMDIPFDALIGATTGLMGMAAANAVEIKYRDEKVSEGMLLYAQDLAKIKNMGLDPAIEGGLKMKLADAYQTGLENIVRASGGNRNLVLGNQGQLDKARMEGIVAITAMDIDRSDKAMATFGEVQKYINDFDSRRDIANNERKYSEDQMNRAAASNLAQQGMSNLIAGIENAKENAPGSMNDMRRQLFQFHATGLLPNAEPGAPGSLEFKEAAKIKSQAKKTTQESMGSWIKTMNMEERNVLSDILSKNPNLDPMENENASVDDLKNHYDEVTGSKVAKQVFTEEKGISELTTAKTQEVSDEVTGKADKQPIVTEKKYVEPGQSRIELTTLAPGQSAPDKPKVGGAIVTNSPVPEKTLVSQLVAGANGEPTGVNTLDYGLGNGRGESLEQKALEYLDRSKKQDETIDRITNNALREAGTLGTLIH